MSETIDIEDLREAGEDGGDLMGFFCRGHVTKYKFANACNKYTEAHPSFDRRYVREEQVHHIWWRTVPISGEPGQSQFIQVEPRSRGAWPATVWDQLGHTHSEMYRHGAKEYARGRDTGFREGTSWALRNLPDDARDQLMKIFQETNPTEQLS